MNIKKKLLYTICAYTLLCINNTIFTAAIAQTVFGIPIAELNLTPREEAYIITHRIRVEAYLHAQAIKFNMSSKEYIQCRKNNTFPADLAQPTHAHQTQEREWQRQARREWLQKKQARQQFQEQAERERMPRQQPTQNTQDQREPLGEIPSYAKKYKQEEDAYEQSKLEREKNRHARQERQRREKEKKEHDWNNITHYGTLQIPRQPLNNIFSDDIKTAYKSAARICHPDRPTGDTAKFQQLQTAYETLSDQTKRQHYDAQLSAHGFE